MLKHLLWLVRRRRVWRATFLCSVSRYRTRHPSGITTTAARFDLPKTIECAACGAPAKEVAGSREWFWFADGFGCDPVAHPA